MAVLYPFCTGSQREEFDREMKELREEEEARSRIRAERLQQRAAEAAELEADER